MTGTPLLKKIDKLGGLPCKETTCRNYIIDLMEELDLLDIYRECHAKTRTITYETKNPKLKCRILHPTREFRRDLCILPVILVGIYISHLRKYCFAVFILTKHFCESSNTYGSSTHSANIWHADKTEVVTVPFEKIHLLNDFFNLLYLKLWSENIFKTRLVSSEKYKPSFFS